MQPDEKTALFDEIITDMTNDADRLLTFIRQVCVGDTYGVRPDHMTMWRRLETIQYQSEMLGQRIRLAKQAHSSSLDRR